MKSAANPKPARVVFKKKLRDIEHGHRILRRKARLAAKALLQTEGEE